MRQCPFGKGWKDRYLKAIKLALDRGHIKKHEYYELKKLVKEIE